MTVSKNNVRTADRLTSETRYDQDEEDAPTKIETTKGKDVQDISFFCDKHESSGDEDEPDVEEKD